MLVSPDQLINTFIISPRPSNFKSNHIINKITTNLHLNYITFKKTKPPSKTKTDQLSPICFVLMTTRVSFIMVGVTGIEPAASWSQTRRATSCATPRYCILAWLVLRFCVLWRCINKMRPQAALRCARKMRLHIKEKRYTLCQSGLSAPKRLAR